jgi:serine/threonine protein kinase
MSDAVVGTEVDGYRIQAVLGRGGMGTVYKAEDVNLSRTVAIKRINPGQQERESFIHRFRSEAQALARIDSPNIVGVYALRETDIGLLIVMEYVAGGTLKDPIEQQGAIDPNQAIPILEQTLQAFHDAHSAGVIHRDIKPENVMLTQDGKVKVTDFGIAKLRQPDSGETVTQGGQGGTLKYMSPEQISNISAVDARSDLYSLGMTAYEILSGSLPFKESDTDFDIMRKVVEGEIPPPDELNPDIPSGLAQWVVGAIEKQQDDRYQSAEEMLEALRDADRQSERTVTQPEWEVDDGSSDVDQTQTVVPDDADRTQTVVPGGDQEDEEDDVDPGGKTVMGGGTVLDEGGATQPAVPDPTDESGPPPDEVPTERGPDEATADPDAAEPAEAAPSGAADTDDEGMSMAVVGGGLVVALLVAAGAVFAFTQTGGDGGSAATLSLSTAPAGATVLVNGDTAGTTPVSGYSMQAGAVQLEVRKDGYQALDTTFTASAGSQVALQNLALAQASAETAGSANPTGGNQSTTAASTADPAGAQPESTEPDPPPEATAAAADPATADAGASETTGATEPETEPSTGTVSISTNPVGTIRVDGEKRTSAGTIQLSAGEHTVSCRHPTGGPSTQTTVTVAAGQTETLTCYTEHSVNINTDGVFGQVWLNGTNTGKQSNAMKPLSLPPGTHRIEVRRRTMDGFQVNGGKVKVTRGSESAYESFTGSSYEVQVEPTFEKVKHAILFEVSTN